MAKLKLYEKKYSESSDNNSVEGLTNKDMAWGFFSDSQDFLLDFMNQTYNNNIVWTEARSLGMGYWLRNIEALVKYNYTVQNLLFTLINLPAATSGKYGEKHLQVKGRQGSCRLYSLLHVSSEKECCSGLMETCIITSGTECYAEISQQ
jgi:hypothetical protein